MFHLHGTPVSDSETAFAQFCSLKFPEQKLEQVFGPQSPQNGNLREEVAQMQKYRDSGSFYKGMVLASKRAPIVVEIFRLIKTIAEEGRREFPMCLELLEDMAAAIKVQ